MSGQKLECCPFCGGVAEADYHRSYRSLSSGHLGKAVAIYCCGCNADMILCLEDHPEVDPEALMSELVDNWNKRALPRASGVPEAEAVAWRWPSPDGTDWIYSTQYPGSNYRRSLYRRPDVKPLYAAPPPVAAPSGEAIKEAIDDFEQAVYDLGWQEREGPGMSRHNEVKREYNKARAALCALFEAAPLSLIASEPKDAGSATDAAYHERNQVVAALARCFPSGVKKTAIDGWDTAWHNCVYIDLPTGQASWHFHDDDAGLFEGLPPYKGEWDGHSTPEKYERLSRLKDAGSGEGQEMTKCEQWAVLETNWRGDDPLSTLEKRHAAGYRITRTAPSRAKPEEVR